MRNQKVLNAVDTRGKESARIYDVHLLIELTDFCNQRCIMCKHSYSDIMHGNQPLSFLEPRLFRKIVADLKSGTFNVTSIDPLWAGESMLHPYFKELIGELFHENKQSQLFRGFVLNTNASLMTAEISDLFLDYAQYAQAQPGFFFKLILSLEAIRPETYAKIRNVSPDVLKRVIANIEYLVGRRREMKLTLPNLAFSFIVMKENYNEAKEFLEYWKGYLQKHSNCPFEVLPTFPLATDRDAIYFRQLISSNPQQAIALHRKVAIELGLITDEVDEPGDKVKTRRPLGRQPCGALWRTPNISASGVVTPCCRDMELYLQVGNIQQSSLKEIWSGKAITDLRLAHIKGDLSHYSQCLHCVEPEGGVLSQEEIDAYLKSLHNKGIDVVSQAKLSVCILSREYPPDTCWGGIGTYTHRLAQGLVAVGHTVHVVCQSLDVDREYNNEGVHVYRVSHKAFFPVKGRLREFGLRWEYSRSVCEKVREIVERERIDIVEAPNISGEGLIYSFNKKVPLVTRLHTHFSEVAHFLNWKMTFDRRMSCWFENAAILRSDMVTCSTKAHARLVAKELGIDSGKIKIVPLGVRMPNIFSGRQENAPMTVLFVGRLEKRKGIHTLMEAVPMVLKEIPNAKFIIVGRDSYITDEEVNFHGPAHLSYKAKLIKMLPEECRGRVEFLGYVPEEALGQLYSSCDIFVAPSLYESFGQIYIEAMSYGKPVIGCGVGGVPEVIIDGQTGILVPPGDPARLSSAIVGLLSSPATCQKMGEAARDHVKESFSLEEMITRTVSVYEEVLSLHASRR